MASRTLTIVMEGDSKSAVRALGRMDRGMGRVAKAAGRATKFIAGFGVAMGVAAAGAATLSVKRYAELGDQVHKMALRTGFATETLSELAHAAELSGTSLENVEKAVRTMQRSIYDATRGLSTQTDALDALGLKIEDLQGKKPEEQFDIMTAALADVEDASMRSALAATLFGRAGTQLLPMLADGAAGLEAMRKEARDLGIVMSEEDAAAAAEFNDNMTRLGKRIDAFKFQLARQLVPRLIELQEWLGPKLSRAGLWLSDVFYGRVLPAVHAIAEVVRSVAIPFLTLLQGVITDIVERAKGLDFEERFRWLSDNKEVLLSAGVALVAFALGVKVANAALVAFTAIKVATAAVVAFTTALKAGGISAALLAVGLNPVTLIVLAVVAAVALLAGGFVLLYQRNENFRNFVHAELLPTLSAVGDAFVRLAGWIRDRLGNALAWVREHWETLGPILSAPVRLTWLVIQQVFDAITSIVRAALAVIRGDWDAAWEIMVGLVTRTGERIQAALAVALDFTKALAQGVAQLAGWLGDRLAQLRSWAFSAGGEVARAFAAGVGDLAGGIAGGIGGFLGDAARNAIPGAAAGGIVSATPGGRIVRVGEGGQDEAIVPLRRGGGGGFGGNTYILQVDATGGDPNKIADVLFPALVRLDDRGSFAQFSFAEE